jgi:transcriptional regulator with XRE-family HTH domain
MTSAQKKGNGNGNGNNGKLRIDRAFFLSQMLLQKLSQRALADKIGIDPAALSLILNGKKDVRTGKPRIMQLHEAQAVARVLKLQVSEVLARAGVRIDLADQMVSVKGSLSADGNVTMRALGTEQLISVPRELHSGSYALLVRAPGHHLDKWLVLVSGLQLDAIDCFGCHALCAFEDGKQIVGYVHEGYTAGTINLFQFITGAKLMREDARVTWARHVTWLKAPSKRGE